MKAIERLLELQGLEMGPKAGAPDSRASIEALRKEIPAPILAHYDRLRARDKKGVALVRNRVCTGCMMGIASGPYAALLRDDDISMCDNCARYLILAPEPPAEPAASPKPDKPAPRRKRKAKPEATG
jgi:hypothetical protein